MSDKIFLGLDLGQAQDFSALARLDRPLALPKQRPTYRMNALHRWPLGTPYTAVSAAVAKMLQLPAYTKAVLAVDHTGVGRPVMEMLFDELKRIKFGGFVVPITITAGQTVTHLDGGAKRVPKRELVSVLQVLLQSKRLQIPRTLELAQLLVKEMANFKVKITESANETFNAREGTHDDLVLATALAAWCGELALPRWTDATTASEHIVYT